jgi:PAS domain S-box-containing protein
MPPHATDNQTSRATRVDPTYLESLFSGARLAIVACEPDGRMLAWNRAAEALFPQLDQQWETRDAAELFPEEDRLVLQAHRDACVDSLEPQEFNWYYDRSATAPIVYAVWWTPVVEENGRLRGLSLWFRDITQRVRLKRTVETRQRLNVLGSLAGAVAHHYNNLLCSIATSLEYASNMTTTSAMRRAMQRTVDAVTRAAEVTRQLLVFARADHRERTYSDLTEAVLYYVDENEQKLADQGIELRLDWQNVAVCPIPREQFGIVLDNLVRNAVEAMPNGGKLVIQIAQHDARHLAVNVTDSGPGIPPGAIEHLFEPFFTTKGVLGSGAARNAGMGLAVVHGFVSEMGGYVSAGNVGGNGARFEVILPIRRDV